MGNNRSRVTPVRPLKILDSQTRARYKNQQELIKLQVKLRQLKFQENEALSRLAFDQHDAKMKLHELRHESGQRQLFKKFNRRNRQDSTSSVIESDISDESDVSVSDTPSLLLHNHNASIEWEKSSFFPDEKYDITNPTKSSNVFQTFQLRYLSKLDPSRHLFEQNESFVSNDHLSLKQHTEILKKSIKISVARAARDSRVVARRKTQLY
ncbi:unnamed protein product [Rotaria sordida]|uniref:Uncharacterized protein n=1 Tax=Rotaria sordida TaxID=392033 RepID=A0A813SH79_9BILA|nr:unnamed protein product [Rotaria sordida]CAF0759321.1 unnamed protein product [Rotaria sordida]CAF0775660.1 unnamed protein product [Rotaria sordida]CAF0796998.1 unnamed protein product [Rotaria sordida]CAF0799301.1 unnamed protein product [Rotaria sordida]